MWLPPFVFRMTSTFSRVPVLDVTKDNIVECMPSIQEAIREASFIAVDCVRQVLHL